MNPNGALKALVLSVLAVLACTAVASAEQMMFVHEGWLCASPEAYEQAVAEQKQRNVQEWDQLKKEQADKRACLYVGPTEIDGIIAPYVSVIETRGDKMNIQFFVKYDERIELLHHKMNWVRFVGWTDVSNLKTVASMAR